MEELFRATEMADTKRDKYSRLYSAEFEVCMLGLLLKIQEIEDQRILPVLRKHG